jgi:chemotaxis protein MotB
MAAKGDKGGKASIIIRREEVVQGGHHGGAWKVAYADFVTAMMAFFLLMWLLNATTAEQRSGIADYFSPTNLMASSKSGFGAPFGGKTPNDDGALASDRGSVQLMNEKMRPSFDVEEDDSDTPASAASMPNAEPTINTRTAHAPHQPGGSAERAAPKPGDLSKPGSAAAPGSTPQPPAAAAALAQANEAQLRAELAQKERTRFEEAAQQIRDQVAKDPALADLARQLAIDITPEGLRIQILDEDKQAMFATGSAVLNDRARALLQKIAPVLMKLPERLSITGHTDATPYHGGDRSNWELSADRANATRRLLAEMGVPEVQVQTVSGQADRDPLLPADPLAAANRRIAIVVLRNAKPPKTGP